MGLDVFAYSKARKAENQTFDADGEPLAGEDCQVTYENPDFPGRCDEFPDRTIVFIDGEHISPFGRSYSGYNRWREQLAELAGYPLTKYEGHFGGERESYAAGAWGVVNGPFWEMIYFSDCEGCIGTAVCKKLAADFADYQAKADAHQDEYFRQGYAEMRQSFEHGSDGGFVRFG